MESLNLLDYTLSHLRATEVSLAEIHRKTALGETWLSQLRSGKIPNPTVTKIQVLADYFRDNAQREAA